MTYYDKSKNTGNGFTFQTFNAHDMLFTIRDAVETYKDKKTWKKIIGNAMKADYSWDKSADEYIKIYEELTKKECKNAKK